MPLDLPSIPRRLAHAAAVPVAIVSHDPRVVAALDARLSAAPELWLTEPALAQVIIWDPPAPITAANDVGGDLPTLPFESRTNAEPPAVIALTHEHTDPMPLLAAGVRGLVSHDIGSERLRAVIVAAQLGLTILDDDSADAIVSAWSPASEPAPRRAPDRLTTREREVLELLADGLSNRGIAQVLGISSHTVKFHVDALLDKLSARSRTHVVVKAVREGLLELV